MHDAPSLPPEDLSGLLADSYSLGMAGVAPFPYFLRFAASLPTRSNFTATGTTPVDTVLPVALVATDAPPPIYSDALDNTAGSANSPSQFSSLPVADAPESNMEPTSLESAGYSAAGARRSLQEAAGEVVQVPEGESAAWRALRVLISKVCQSPSGVLGSSMSTTIRTLLMLLLCSCCHNYASQGARQYIISKTSGNLVWNHFRFKD